jgi:hypothetical protein
MSLELLKKYHDMGLTLIPMTIKDGEKLPLVQYKGYKEKTQDFPTLQGLFEQYRNVKPLHWAVYAINGTVGLDWDTPKDYETFFADIDTLTLRTPSGGYHCFLKTLVNAKPFSHMGCEYKPGELCTIAGEGYTIIKDSPIKEIPDLEEILKKKMPSFKIHKEGKNFSLLEVLDKMELFPDRIKGKKEDWHTDCPLCGAVKKEGSHFYYYHNTNSWYCHKCKKGGNAVNFITTLKSIKVKDAIQFIEDLLGIESSNKKNSIPKSTVRQNGILYEQILTKEGYQFVNFRGDAFEYHKELIDYDNFGNEVIIVPCTDEEIVKGMVRITREPSNYENLKTLLHDINGFIYKWLDISDQARKFYSYYVLQTWVYENFHSIGYARALGDLGTGKTRFLDVIGGLCYKPMIMTGAVGAAPIFRIMDKHRGTLVIDEANFAQTDETAAILQIFNSGYEQGKPVIRMDKDDLSKIQVFNPFCPKVLGTRKKFTDAALESRCYTEVLTQTSRDDIPALIGDGFFKDLETLAAKLLDFRLKNINIIKPDETLQADFLGIEMRLIQKALPLAAIVKTDPEAYKEFVEYIKASQEDLIEDRQGSWEGMVVGAILNLLETGLSTYTLENILISGEDIAEKLNEDLPEKKKTNSQKVGKMLKTLGFNRIKKGVSSGKDEKEKTRKFKRALDTDLKLLSKLVKRYTFSDDENYPKLKRLVSSVSSDNGESKKSNNNINSVTVLLEKDIKNPDLGLSETLDTLDTLDTKIEKTGRNWEKQNQKSINSLTKTDFAFWYCEQNKNDSNTPSEIMPIVERIFKITPEGQQGKIIVEVRGEVSEGVLE